MATIVLIAGIASGKLAFVIAAPAEHKLLTFVPLPFLLLLIHEVRQLHRAKAALLGSDESLEDGARRMKRPAALSDTIDVTLADACDATVADVLAPRQEIDLREPAPMPVPARS
jgi:hypothetical protein